MAAPSALGFGSAGLVLAVATGVLLAGLALGADETMPLSTHLAFDQLAVVALGGGALGLAFAGDGTASLVLAAGAAIQLTLIAATRWSRRR